jgi:hypothetical protein
LLLCAEEILEFMDVKIFKCIKCHRLIIRLPLTHRIHISLAFTERVEINRQCTNEGTGSVPTLT